jgi:hypothetical protein
MALSAYTHAEGSYNIAMGIQTAYLKTSGRFNTYIGGYKNATADLTGEKNVWIGSYANQYGTDTDSTTLVGYEAGRYATGSFNTFLGSEAGKGGTTSAPYSSGTHNTALGRQALGGFTTGGSNTAIGSQAGNSIKTGTENVFLGANAGYNATGSMSYGVAIGSHAGYQNNNGSVVYIGRYAGYAGSGAIGGGNIGIGYQALFTNRSSDETGMKWNIAIGRAAMSNTTDTLGAAHSNVAIGYTALKNIESGSRNIAIGGYQGGGDGGTGEFLKNGDDNTFVGAKAGQGIDSGNIHSDKNVFIGSLAGNNQNGVDGNVGVGRKALLYARGNYSVAVGYEAGDHATGSYNTFVGGYAGQGGTTSAPFSSGENNVAVGYQALDGFTTGGTNVAIGSSALGALTTAVENVAIGHEALDSATTNGYNTVIGFNAGKGASNVNYTYNVLIGRNAGKKSSGDGGDSIYNVGVGNDVLTGLNGGDKNVAIGRSAGSSITTGTNNVLLGYDTEPSAVGGVDQIVIGPSLVGTANQRVHIGDDTSHIYNDFNSNATWTHSSDKRQKKDIEKDTLGLDFINDIEPVTYKHKSPSEFPKEWTSYDVDNTEPMGGDKTIHGLIAQNVKEALDKQGVDTFGGWDKGPDGRQNVSFEAFVLPLINSVKELSSENKELKDELNELKILIKKKLGDK